MEVNPSFALNGSSTTIPESIESSKSKEGRKEVLFKAIQNRLQHQYPTRYLWDFYHDRHSTASDYSKRLTQYNETPIDNWMTFMQYYNNFPFNNLHMKDAVHFFKHTVSPTWEDARNQDGGAWYFKVPDEVSPAKEEGLPYALQFFQQVLLAAVGEDFADVIQPRDDLCGISFTKRWKASMIMIWTRKGSEEKTIRGIREVIESQAPDNIRELLKNERFCYYKKHREHDDFDEELAKQSLDAYNKKKMRGEITSPDDEQPEQSTDRAF
ncbi:uncharacterized protein KY384_004948 [Bacidia gigantensis]|uniref:uncharacterized protein n=1 Tax=Bacidia gigantensis TaxID=2732470 RepID=UPI001D04D603|nr:uncharacterized protein KY384_004948 [Bacidia gigantensis]KAG8530446.1 hypothetical protein KY384_004948 [Bacidia gigantensis]